MSDASGPDTPSTAGRQTIRCEQCGQQVPAMPTCIRCGDPLGPELRRGATGRVRDSYAAAPEESARAVRLVSTLYPALPREEIRTFQTALVAGTILVVVLAALGFFPVAVVAAAVLVPLVTVIYLYDVDTYEDEPVRVVALTFLWGIVTGALFAWLLDQLAPVTAGSVGWGSAVGGSAGAAEFPWARGVVAPVVAGALMALGPILLLGQKRFNDVLDGATFGVASAVAFVGAQTIVTSLDLFRSGLQPTGDVLPWIIRLIGLGVAMPVIAAGAIGGFLGVVWLRYRGPDEHEDMLGPLGSPVVAAAMGGVLLLAAGLIQALVLPTDTSMLVFELVILVGLAIVALIWLRRIIHLGLLQESLEIPIGPEIVCANCGKPTPRHSYCGECGVSLRALPKARGEVAAASPAAGDVAAPHGVRATLPADAPSGTDGVGLAVAGVPAVATAAPAPARRGWLGPQRLLIVFAVLLGAITAIALVIAYVTSQGLDEPECEGDIAPCAAVIAAPAPPGPDGIADAPFPPLERYRDESVGFGFEFDPDIWTVAQKDTGIVFLSAAGGSVTYIAEAVPVGVGFDVQGLFNGRRNLVAGRLLGFQLDREPARQLIGNAILGHRKRDGVGALFGGTLDTAQGPSVDMAVAEVGATDGEIVAIATVIAPAELREAALEVADSINSTFTWPSDPVVQ